jgi:hypothetical protein
MGFGAHAVTTSWFDSDPDSSPDGSHIVFTPHPRLPIAVSDLNNARLLTHEFGRLWTVAPRTPREDLHRSGRDHSMNGLRNSGTHPEVPRTRA